MHNRTGGSPARASHADELTQSADTASFGDTFATLALRGNLPPAELPDKMECCASTQAYDPTFHPSTSTPARPSTSCSNTEPSNWPTRL